MDCVHAIEQGDGREVMLMNGFYIKQWNDDFCLGPKE